MKKILIVEDEEIYLKILREELSKHGFQVFVARDGEEGLEMAISKRPDLLLLDLKLPKMDGMTMLSELRKKERNKNTKVIILTNLEPDNTLIRESVENQPIYYLVKSDTKLSDLVEKVKELI